MVIRTVKQSLLLRDLVRVWAGEGGEGQSFSSVTSSLRFQ